MVRHSWGEACVYIYILTRVVCSKECVWGIRIAQVFNAARRLVQPIARMPLPRPRAFGAFFAVARANLPTSDMENIGCLSG